MKGLNHLEPLDERLRMMPKPNLSKEKQQQIKYAIQNTRVTKTTPRKKWNYKGITATIGALAAVFLFAVLLYGHLNQQPQSSELLFSSFVDEKTAKINGVSGENGYTSSDQEVIDLFNETIGTMEFTETKSGNTAHPDKLELYNENDHLLKTLQFGDRNIVTIDGKEYEVDASKWREFKDVFFSEIYLITDEQEEITVEEPVENQDFTKLLDVELAKAPSERDWNKVLEYVKEGAPSNHALLLAAKENKVAIVPELLVLGADPNTTDEGENTAFMMTTSIDIASSLLENGADITWRNKRGHNALVDAVFGHQTEMVQLLLDSGADPNTTVQPNNDVSILWVAAKFNDQSIKDLLIQHGADLIEGSEYESWMVAQKPNLKKILSEGNDLFEYAAIGRIPDLPAIQVPADPRTFPNRFVEPFESFAVEDGTADVYGDHIFIKPDGQDLYTAYRYELNPGDNVTVSDIENSLGEPSSFSTVGDQVFMSYDLEHYQIRFSYDGSLNYPKDESAILTFELVYKQTGVIKEAEEVLGLLADKNMTELAKHVHPEKGVLFAPYLQLTPTPMPDDHERMTFSADEIPGLLQDQTVYHWGVQEASGLPMDMTPVEYFKGYAYATKNPDALYIDEQNLTGPEFFTEKVRGVFPGAHMVEFAFYETEPGYEMSWVDTTLVFEEYKGEWKLVAIMHNAWTP